MGTRKMARKGSRYVEQLVRKCINCEESLDMNEHSCRKCAIVQEDTWLEMPTKAEMQYKHQTHQIPCAYKRINHFNEKLESYDWLLMHFTELKSREKLYEQDKIWKSICEELDWEFIPSL
jgi:hypothetical protein